MLIGQLASFISPGTSASKKGLEENYDLRLLNGDLETETQGHCVAQ